MKIQNMDYMLILAEYRPLFGILAILFLLGALTILITVVIEKFKILMVKSTKKRELDKKSIKNLEYSKVKDERKAEIMRTMVAPDAVNPGPNGYLVIDDGGTEVYIRNFTVASIPKNAVFVETFSGLLDFPGCESSIFIRPVSEAAISHKVDKQITVLASEAVSADGDPNRTRKLKDQYRELYQWAEDIESGDTKFFDVGFLFTFSAKSLQELNKMTDSFHSRAIAKNIVISNCYSVQAEAWMSQAPFNGTIKVGSKYIHTDGVKYLPMDKYSVSTVFNYTQSSFSHRDGVILGYDMNTKTPIFYDLFDPSHDGYTIVIAGKTGSGKSATIKMYACRSIPHGYRYVCIDSQLRKGTNEAEFAAIAGLVNGAHWKISSDSKEIMNPFEINETTKTIKSSNTSVREIRTLELNDKIIMVVNDLSTMLQGQKQIKDLESFLPINRIITDIVADLYAEIGLVEGNADSLYEEGTVVVNGELTSGRVKKTLPTITDFYKKLLISQKTNNDASLSGYYNLIVMGLKDFVRELYYTSQSLKFLTKEEVQQLKFRDNRGKTRTYIGPNGIEEEVVTIKGIRPYFDGQSTLDIQKDCPFTDIDISLLPEAEKNLARQIAMDFVNESFIKKNSESVNAADKLVCIFDECHENFNIEYARLTLDNVVRTARKRHVAVFISTQTIREFDYYKETKNILGQATAKFIFKQDPQDKDYLLSQNLTESQVSYIVNNLGGDDKNEEDKDRHRGEVCIVDNKNVAFCKVQYLRSTEALAVETDASKIAQLMTVVA